MPRTRKPLPPVEIMARPKGCISWVCPGCHNIKGPEHIKWKKAHLRCFQCERRYRFGLGFTSHVGGVLPPYNAVHPTEPFNRYTVNALENMPKGTPAIARVSGRIEWVCPTCGTAQASITKWMFCDITCTNCHHRWFLRTIIWDPATAFTIRTPYDWTPHVTPQSRLQSIPAETARTSPGGPSA